MDTQPPSTGRQHTSAGNDKIYSFDAHAGSVYEITVTDSDDFDSITKVLGCNGQAATCNSGDTCFNGHVEVRGVLVGRTSYRSSTDTFVAPDRTD